MLSEKEDLESFMSKLCKGEITRKKPLKFHVLDEGGNLKEINEKAIFVQTGDDTGFILYKGFDIDNACMCYSYPGLYHKSNKHTHFLLRTCCSNLLNITMESEEKVEQEKKK